MTMPEQNHLSPEQKKYLLNIVGTVNRYLSNFPNEQEKLDNLRNQLLGETGNINDRKNYRGHVTASATIVNSKDQVLLIKHNALGLWIPPGGHSDEQEEPISTALREALEETGMGTLHIHDWHLQKAIPYDISTHAIPSNPKKGEEAHSHHDFRYIFMADDDYQIGLQQKEVSDSQWVSLEEAALLLPRFPWTKAKVIIDKNAN